MKKIPTQPSTILQVGQLLLILSGVEGYGLFAIAPSFRSPFQTSGPSPYCQLQHRRGECQPNYRRRQEEHTSFQITKTVLFSKPKSSKDEDEDDPWAGHRMYTDESDTLEDDDDDDDDAWLKDMPGARDLSPKPEDLSKWKRGDSSSLLNDNFYSSFDEEKFQQMNLEYSASARGMSVEEYKKYVAQTSKDAADAVTGFDRYAKTADLEKKQSEKITCLQDHLRHQVEMFGGEMAKVVDSEDAVKESVRPVLKFLVRKALKQMVEYREEALMEMKRKRDETNSGSDDDELKMEEKNVVYKILDVGCGTGSLFPFYLQTANEAGIQLEITAVDLSPSMAKLAAVNSEMALDEEGGRHKISVVTGEFVSLIMGGDYENCTDKDDASEALIGGGDGIEDEETQIYRGVYDAVVINSCFGNFYSPHAVMSSAAQALNPSGILAITHPLGTEFVKTLNEEDPDTVPHHLPTILDFRDLIRSQPLTPLDFVQEVDLLDAKKEVQTYPTYFASARRTPHRPLSSVLRLRGKVDAGYGRGGKKLGFPTANLPSSLFADALANVPTGVYFGWAVIEDPTAIRNEGTSSKKGRNIFHKAVVNVGYSPTFEGEENKEKIVEAHLILDDEDDIKGDFYNETMRLALSGFLRREKKFENFPALVQAIGDDVANAKHALGMQPFAALRTDGFLTDPCKRINNTMVEEGEVWVGKAGGDEFASWEFQYLKEAIMATPMGRWAI